MIKFSKEVELILIIKWLALVDSTVDNNNNNNNKERNDDDQSKTSSSSSNSSSSLRRVKSTPSLRETAFTKVRSKLKKGLGKIKSAVKNRAGKKPENKMEYDDTLKQLITPR